MIRELIDPRRSAPRTLRPATTIAAVGLAVLASVLVPASVVLGRALVDGAAIVGVVGGIAAIGAAALAPTVGPHWLWRLGARDEGSRLLDAAMWVIPAVTTLLATVGAASVLQAMMDAGLSSELFLLSGSAFVGSALYGGILTTAGGVRLCIERVRRRRGWRPRHEVEEAAFEERRRASDAAFEARMAAPDPTAPREGETFVREVVDERPGVRWEHMVLTSQRLLLRDPSRGWEWREHSELVGVDRSRGVVTVSYVGAEAVVLEADGVDRIAAYLDGVLDPR